ncbi:hypothetical protein WR25_24803 [Diploscapter pachys]|uniref:UPAR/Ly6 domain-containing protein n=1 Tax=Diploscapter pachys TaxID=2018661 RepID=A0A2A2KCA3_9BILA|nr:hypothetical protein WR25_24803 [Diploscapter pachys]
MRLGILLALVAAGFAHECSIAAIINAGSSCNAGDTEDCYCDGNRCNEVTGIKEELAPSHIEDFPSNIVCYVGYYASDQFTVGDLVQCGQNSVCMKVNGTTSGYSVEIYACMPSTLCTALFPGIADNQEMCNGINGTTITGCCCTKQDCKDLMNPSIPPPPTQNWGGPTIQCYSGITLNGVVQAGGNFTSCQGDCASARIRTIFNGTTLWGEVFSCDPANIFSAIGFQLQ